MKVLSHYLSVHNFESFIKRELMALRDTPQTTVFHSGILEWNPEPEQSLGSTIEVGGVLVNMNFIPYFGLLEDAHRLHNNRLWNAHPLADFPDSRPVGDLLKERVELVKCMSQLIDSLVFGDNEFFVLIESNLFTILLNASLKLTKCYI